MELKITKDKVLAAAAKCSTAKATLETLFPEAFMEEKYFDFGESFNLKTSGEPFKIGWEIPPLKLKGRCLLLDPSWEVEVVKHGSYTLIIPTRKTY